MMEIPCKATIKAKNQKAQKTPIEKIPITIPFATKIEAVIKKQAS